MIEASYTGEIRRIIYECCVCTFEEVPEMWKYDAAAKKRSFPKVEYIDLVRCADCTKRGVRLPPREGR